MVEKKSPKNQKTDKAQSERFKKTARELEAAGELDLTDAEKILAPVLKNIQKNKFRG